MNDKDDYSIDIVGTKSQSQLPKYQTNILEPQSQGVFIGSLFVSINSYIVKVLGKRIEMPPKEIELLYYFVTHPNELFSREKLLEKVWEVGCDGDTRTVDVHFRGIR
ncbi:MAG: winged helix-turn-helix domain-containing protein [Clostridiales bacterium]|jgi:DNA-binding response OmpR family regulator|nr:winged helix-turn-helix domain-containing protein [Clostridiales bacterium]